jgi:hypothetical protein
MCRPIVTALSEKPQSGAAYPRSVFRRQWGAHAIEERAVFPSPLSRASRRSKGLLALVNPKTGFDVRDIDARTASHQASDGKPVFRQIAGRMEPAGRAELGCVE